MHKGSLLRAEEILRGVQLKVREVKVIQERKWRARK